MCAVSLFAVAGLTGCAGLNGASFPDASINPEQNSLGTIQGSDYGGHAPLVGAHVYVLQPSVHMAAGNNSNTNYTAQPNAYGYQATSLLTANYTAGSGYPTTANTSDPNIPAGWYYETTDSTGRFNISGDYTCTVGLPVYLYLYGGSPTFPSASNTFALATSSSSNTLSTIVSDGTNAIYTYTVASTSSVPGYSTAPENFYIGEAVTMSGFPNNSFNGAAVIANPGNTAHWITLNGTTYKPVLTTTQFSYYGSANGLAAGVYDAPADSTSTPIVVAQPTFNPAVVNLAVLGNCPSTGNFTYDPVNNPNGLQFVYVNEVSTVAAAYAFRPFTLSSVGGNGDPDGLSGANSAIYIGTSSTNLAGLQNAAMIAGQLYDVQGSNLSTTYAGEGHIARSTTTNGNGGIPQTNIDTLANILAACVDTNNTATTLGANGGQGTNMSAQCSTLFNYATLTGVPVSGGGQQPYDTATAAINIARHPAGPPYSYSATGSSNFMTALYTLPTGNVPFAPYLTTQPNDFTIGIVYNSGANPASGTNPYAYTIGAESLAIDKIGNVWVTTQPSPGSFQGYLEEWSPVGVLSNVTYQTDHIYGYVTIDVNGSPWTGSATSLGYYTYQHNTNSTLTSGTPTLGSLPVTYTYNEVATTGTTSVGSYTYASVADSSGNIYFTSNLASGDSVDYIEKFIFGAQNPPGQYARTFGSMTNINTSGNGMSHAAIDAAGYMYADYNAAGGVGTPQITRNLLTSSARYNTAFPVTNATAGCTSLTNPESMAVTRSGDVIVSDYHNGTGTVNAATSSAYYITAAGVCTQLSGATLQAGMNSPFGAAVDGNDYVYLTNRGGASITVLNTQAGSAAGTIAVSPSTGYEPQYQYGNTLYNEFNGPLNIAIDPSGNVWVTDYGNNTIEEIVGLAYPTTTPLSAAAIPVSYTQGSIGYRP